MSSCGGKPLLPICFPPQRLVEQGCAKFPVPPSMSKEEHAGLLWTSDTPLEAALASVIVDGSQPVAAAAPPAPPVPDNVIVSEQLPVCGEGQCERGHGVPRRLMQKTSVSPSLTSSASAPALTSISASPNLPVSLACAPRGVDVVPMKRARHCDNLDSFHRR